MHTRGFCIASLLSFVLTAAVLPMAGQTLLATVDVGQGAYYLAANPQLAPQLGIDPGLSWDQALK